MLTQTITPPAAHKTLQVDDLFDSVFANSPSFRIELGYEAALGFIQRIDQYNDFHAADVIDALEHVDRVVPRKWYGIRNPNNGERDYTISVGREGSPVIYIDRFELPSTRPLTDHTMKTICREMELIGRADEADFTVRDFKSGSRRIEFRFWWD